MLAPISLAPHSSASPPQCSVGIDFVRFNAISFSSSF